MKYVGTIFNDVIVAKGINYTDLIDETEIELTEYEYNTIPIPCKLVDGEFVACEFPCVAETIDGYGGVAQFATGSYTGTGTYGADNPNTLTFDFEPRMVLVYSTDCGTTNVRTFLHGAHTCNFWQSAYPNHNDASTSVSVTLRFEINGKTVSWYNTYTNPIDPVKSEVRWKYNESTAPQAQGNAINATYYYIAIG